MRSAWDRLWFALSFFLADFDELSRVAACRTGVFWNPKKDTALQAVAKRVFAFGILTALPMGCVQRQMDIETNPSGAVVYMNDREIGRTPFKRTFLWYGVYDVVIRKDGYQTLKTVATVNPPLWQLVPLDVVTDFLPLVDERTVQFTLKPDVPVDPEVVIDHAQTMRAALESSDHTIQHNVLAVHPPATLPTTRMATQPATAPQ